MITKQDKKKAQLYYKENIEGEPLTMEVPINCYLAACEEKNKEIEKYIKYTKHLFDVFEFAKWVEDNNWKHASQGWYNSNGDHTVFKTTGELFDIFSSKSKNKKQNGRTKSKIKR